MKAKTCTKCKKKKSLSEFHKDKTTPDGHSYWCKLCKAETHKSLYRTVYDKKKWMNGGWKKNLDKNYGEGAADWYERQFEKQNGCCAICGKHQSKFKKRLDLDHNHLNGKWRGLLCINCNIATGKLRCDEGIKLLQKAIKYIEDI